MTVSKGLQAIFLMAAMMFVSCGKNSAGNGVGGPSGDKQAEVEAINGTHIDPSCNRVGLVTDSATGLGIAGVPVTDGYTYTTTDVNGVYQMVAHPGSRAVYTSLPSGYDIPVDAAGQVMFWGTETYRNDFTLTTSNRDWNDFSILAMSDIHFYLDGENSTSEVRLYEQKVLPDIIGYISNFDNVISLNLGDMVSNHTHRLADAKKELAKIRKGGKPVPMLVTIGNHDHDNVGTSTLECSREYFEAFGPENYSMNIGKAHIVCMDNLIYAGNGDGGYGKSMQYDKGLTGEQWAWLQADLATVKDKEDKILLFCVHVPIFNSQYGHAQDIRNLLKTFGESHIFSGHNHYSIRRQFTSGYNGLSGRVSEEHNMPPLGGLWRCRLANDGHPAGYFIYRISGSTMSSQYFKPLGRDESYQFDVYDGGASYHEPEYAVFGLEGDAEGRFHFDWKTLWESSEGVDPTGKFIVRVFNAGTRGLGCGVYLTKDGVRTPMTRVSTPQRDQCTFSYLWTFRPLTSGYASIYSKTGCHDPNFWYVDAPCGNPSTEKGWTVEVEFAEPGGTRSYQSSSIRRGPEGYSF